MKLHLPKGVMMAVMMAYTSLTVWSGTEWYGSGTSKDSWSVESGQSITTADGQINSSGSMFLRATEGSTNVTITQLDVVEKNTAYTLNIEGAWTGNNHFNALVIDNLNLASENAVLNIVANNNVQVNNIGASPQSGGITVAGSLQLAAGVGDTDNGFTISVQKGGVLKLHHSNSTKAAKNTRYNFGTLNITNSELQLELWTAADSDIRKVNATDRPIITSAILLDNSTMRIKDGAYQFDGGITVKGTSTLHNEWSKGHTINTLKSEGVATLKLVKQENEWGTYTPWVLLGEGAFCGRVEMTNQDAAVHNTDVKGTVNHYLVLSNGKALSNGEDTYSTVVNLGSGNYDDRNFLSLNTAESYLKGIGGKGVVEICTLEGNAGLTAVKLIINNDNSVTDVFTGTIASGVTLEISGGSQTFGQITNNGTVTVSNDGLFVVQDAKEHAGFSQSSQLLNHDGQMGTSGFITGTINLYTADSTGSGPASVIYNGSEKNVVDGTIDVTLYGAYYVGDSNITHNDVYAAAQRSNEAGDTLSEIVINNGGILTVNATLSEKNDYHSNTNTIDKDSFFSGSIKINGGGVLSLAENSLGWGTSGGGEASPVLTLVGTNEGTLAKVTLNGNQTAQTTFNMNGHALIEASEDSILVDTMSTVINVNGGNNEISVQLRDRGGITYNVANDSSLTVSGKVLARPEGDYSGTSGTVKNGAGLVTFTASDSVFTGKITIIDGTLALAGKNTTLKNGATIASGKKLLFENEDNSSITIENAVDANGYLSTKSGTSIFTGNITGNGTIELSQNSSTGAKIILAGTSNSVKTIDLSNQNKANGQLIIRNGHTETHNLWMRQNTSVLIEKAAKLTLSTAGYNLDTGKISIIGNADNTTKIEATTDDIQYWASRSEYKIINAEVQINDSDNNTQIGNHLANSSVINKGVGSIVITNANNNLTGITAESGDINIQKITVDEINNLKINSNRIIGAHTTGTDEITSIQNLATLTVTTAVAVGENASYYGNLVINSGASLTMDGAMNLYGSLALNTGMELGGDVLAQINALQNGDSMAIFNHVSSLVLNGEPEAAVMTLSESALIEADASLYFKNLEEGLYYITFENNTVSILSNVPEPSTATLSLLALAALASRRRRK